MRPLIFCAVAPRATTSQPLLRMTSSSSLTFSAGIARRAQKTSSRKCVGPSRSKSTCDSRSPITSAGGRPRTNSCTPAMDTRISASPGLTILSTCCCSAFQLAMRPPDGTLRTTAGQDVSNSRASVTVDDMPLLCLRKLHGRWTTTGRSKQSGEENNMWHRMGGPKHACMESSSGAAAESCSCKAQVGMISSASSRKAVVRLPLVLFRGGVNVLSIFWVGTAKAGNALPPPCPHSSSEDWDTCCEGTGRGCGLEGLKTSPC
mmetsp:Transcript_33161/g.61004  ORF Transcript_33161/g.61004 Transcript_33161/m.61004 type:complete len:261 (-) Transcript_33161:777-1559(-)